MGKVLKEFGVAFEVNIVSAHRTPERMFTYAASAHTRGLKVIIAGAGSTSSFLHAGEVWLMMYFLFVRWCCSSSGYDCVDDSASCDWCSCSY